MDSLEQLTVEKPIQKRSSAEARLVIAGPCSAETEAQMFETARQLQGTEINYFRAGIWKPRTSPDSFAGVGEPGLAWLKALRSEFGLATAIEVANARHVELALKYDVDLLWLGARTSVNPFTVQEIADAMRGVKRPVMVKNPINPDLDLWKGALERMLRADVSKVIACHRGFNVYGKALYRNAPLWEIPIELKRAYPELPLICDPSHIGGKREYIEDISRKALELGYEGLMVETHPNPEAAWSDAAQQLTPEAFQEMMARLRFRRHHTDNPSYTETVDQLREAIDNIDEKLMQLLAERMQFAQEIGQLKQANNIAFYQHNRWSGIIENVRNAAKALEVSEDFAMKVFSLIHMESIDMQGE
ncbi:MAG TPA: 3-deoxy-7-phosphoheptulonate synthase [Bacteroidetes bacterium]|nr:3-deoxy-7-phosphoheptulonate synthase [Bacteroidota bacterium]